MAPWLFGGAEPWAALSLAILAWLALGVRLLAWMVAAAPVVRHPRLAAAALIATLVVALQGTPLPERIVGMLNPAAARVQRDARATLLAMDAPARVAPELRACVTGRGMSLSVAPGATRRSALLLGACLALWFVVAESAGSRRTARTVAIALVVGGFALALVSMVQQFSGTAALLWIKTPRDWTRAFGPFTNRNHAAMHLNLLLGLAVGLLLGAIRREPGASFWRTVSSHTANGVALAGMAVALLAGAVFVSLSRGGMLSLLAGFAALFGLLLARGGMAPRRGGWLVGVLLLLAALTAAWLGLEPLIVRLQALSQGGDPSVVDRLAAWRAALGLTLRFPLVGVGVGAFAHAFPLVQTAPLAQRWTHAHNDILQGLAEGGVLGFAATAAVLAVWLRGVWRAWPAAGGRRARFLCGVGAGLVAAAVHSLADFGLHKPANAWLLAVMAGLLSALTAPSDPVTESPPGRAAGLRRHLLCLAALLALVWVTHTTLRAWRAECAHARLRVQFAMIADVRSPRQLDNALADALAEMPPILQDPAGNPDALRELAAAWLAQGALRRGEPSLRGRLGIEALQAAVLAAATAPSDYLNWLTLARVYAAFGLWDEAELGLNRARALVRDARAVRLFAP